MGQYDDYEKVTVDLKRPVKVTIQSGNHKREEVVSQITIREPDAGDLMDAAGDGEDKGKLAIQLFANLSGQPEIVLRKLKAVDFMEVVKVITNFIPDGPTDGETT